MSQPSKTYNVLNIAKLLGCQPLDRRVLEFIVLWNLAVHCKDYAHTISNGWGATCGMEYSSDE